jgi:hypothetical protein
MTAQQICRLASPDHDPIPWADGRDAGMSSEAINHPTNISLRPRAEHKVKSAKVDTPTYWKGKRLSAEQERHRAAMLRIEPRATPKRAWPSRKLPSRPFPKRRAPG